MSRHETIGLAFPGDGVAHIWGAITGEKADGSIAFDCLNGGWSGRFHKDGHITFNDAAGGKPLPAELAWRGVVPREHASDYTSALIWINEQIGKRLEIGS